MEITPDLLKRMRACTDLDMPSDAQIALLDHVDALQQQVNALAAENLYLKDAIATHSVSVHFCEVCGKDDPSENDDICDVLNHSFPATDEIQDEWMAKGLMEAIDVIAMTMSMAGKLNDLAYELRTGRKS